MMHKGEEPGAKIGTPLPATLLGNRADEGILDEIVCMGHVAGQCKSIAPQPRDFFFEKSTNSLILPSNVLDKLPAECGASEKMA
jgi:hypothetical protein